jgi:hypothetical protein
LPFYFSGNGVNHPSEPAASAAPFISARRSDFFMIPSPNLVLPQEIRWTAFSDERKQVKAHPKTQK